MSDYEAVMLGLLGVWAGGTLLIVWHVLWRRR